MEKQGKSISIEIYSDVICPWCYVGKRRLERAVSQVGTIRTQVTWRPFQLNPAMPRGGMERTDYLEAKFGSVDSFRHLEEQVAAAGALEHISFAFDKIHTTPNTFLAHRLIWFAGQHGRQDAIVEGLFKGYFEEGADIESISVLTGIAASAGVDSGGFLATEQGTAEVKAQEAAAHRLGIRAVPYFVLNNGYGISGAQPVGVFLGAFQEVGARAESEASRK